MSKQCLIFSLLILSICRGIAMAADSPCGDWEPYKDEKCFKIIDETFRTYDAAEKICSQMENCSTLPIIHSKDEQDFLSNFLFKTQKKVDNFWIGAKFTSNKFKWTDDSDLSFTNWEKGSPRSKTNYCIQMQSDEASIGKWIDEPCEKKNLVVCQKMQTWSISRLQKTLLDARKELRDSLADARNHIKNIEQNPVVPIDFIYVQLPSQPGPKTLWKTVEWKDVTSDYAGLFFRAEGGNSAIFGDIQEESSPRLTYVKRYDNSCGGGSLDRFNLCSTSGPGLNYSSPGYTAMLFTLSNVEVRPRNKAIRIWKRTN